MNIWEIQVERLRAVGRRNQLQQLLHVGLQKLWYSSCQTSLWAPTGSCGVLRGFWSHVFKVETASIVREGTVFSQQNLKKTSSFKTTSTTQLPVSTRRWSRCSVYEHSTIKNIITVCTLQLNASMEMFEANFCHTGKERLKKNLFLMRGAWRSLLRHSSCPAAADRTDRGNNKAGCFDSCSLVLPRPGLHREVRVMQTHWWRGSSRYRSRNTVFTPASFTCLSASTLKISLELLKSSKTWFELHTEQTKK